jgi:hypothetical protein
MLLIAQSGKPPLLAHVDQSYRWHVCGPLSLIDQATGKAAQAVAAILCQFGFTARHFTYLMTSRIRIIS